MSGTISFQQGVITEHDDIYTVINYNVRYFEPADYRLTITGDVTAEKELTLADLQARAVVKHALTKTCVLNPNGGTMIYNAEHSGPDLMDLLNEIGLKDGANELVATSYDGWSWTFGLSKLAEAKAFLGMKIGDKDLEPTRGYPVTLTIPGEPGACWVKYLKTIEIKTVAESELPGPVADMFSVPYTCYPVNAGFLKPAKDGEEMSSPVHLEGWTFSWPLVPVSKLLLSADYGKHWNEYELPQGMDTAQWVYWKIDWTPPAPGRYLLKVKAQSGEAIQQREDNVVIVVK